jgi:hypothetical protein
MDQEKDEVGPRTWGPIRQERLPGERPLGRKGWDTPSRDQLGLSYKSVGRQPQVSHSSRLGRAGPSRVRAGRVGPGPI